MGRHTFSYKGLALVSRKQLQSCSASPTPSPAVSAGIWGPCGGEHGVWEPRHQKLRVQLSATAVPSGLLSPRPTLGHHNLPLAGDLDVPFLCSEPVPPPQRLVWCLVPLGVLKLFLEFSPQACTAFSSLPRASLWACWHLAALSWCYQICSPCSGPVLVPKAKNSLTLTPAALHRSVLTSWLSWGLVHPPPSNFVFLLPSHRLSPALAPHVHILTPLVHLSAVCSSLQLKLQPLTRRTRSVPGE